MKKELSNILIACIVCGSALFAVGAFDEEPPATYATAHFEGGYILLGEIGQQRYYSYAELSKGDDTLSSGTISEVVAMVENSLREGGKEAESSTWANGIRVKGRVGVQWVGSEAPFTLTTDEFDMLSTEQAPLTIGQVLTELKLKEADVKQHHQMYADQALTFGRPPSQSFLLSKLIAAFRD